MTDLMDAQAAGLQPGREPGPGGTAPGEVRSQPIAATGLAARCRPLLRPAGYFVASRVVVFAVGIVMAVIYPKLRLGQVFGSVWDGRWYLTIAQHGYPHHLVNEGDGSRWAFFPAFPGAVRGLAEVTRLSLPDAAVVAAFVFGLTSALAIWLAVREVFGASDRRPGGAALRLLPHGVRAVPRLHRGPLPHGSSDVPLRAVTPLLGHRGAVCLRCRADPQHRHRRGARRRCDGAPCGLAGARDASRGGRGRRPARACLVHGLQLGDGRHSRGVPDLRAILARPTFRLVFDTPRGHRERRAPGTGRLDLCRRRHGRRGPHPRLPRDLAARPHERATPPERVRGSGGRCHPRELVGLHGRCTARRL